MKAIVSKGYQGMCVAEFQGYARIYRSLRVWKNWFCDQFSLGMSWDAENFDPSAPGRAAPRRLDLRLNRSSANYIPIHIYILQGISGSEHRPLAAGQHPP